MHCHYQNQVLLLDRYFHNQVVAQLMLGFLQLLPTKVVFDHYKQCLDWLCTQEEVEQDLMYQLLLPVYKQYVTVCDRVADYQATFITNYF